MRIWEYVAVAGLTIFISICAASNTKPMLEDLGTIKIDSLETEKIVVKSGKSGTSSSEIVISASKDGASISFWTLDSVSKSNKLFKMDSRKDGKVYINYNDKERELQEFIHRPRILGESLD